MVSAVSICPISAPVSDEMEHALPPPGSPRPIAGARFEVTGSGEDDMATTTSNTWTAPESGTAHLWIVLRRMIRYGMARKAMTLLPWLIAGETARIVGFFRARSEAADHAFRAGSAAPS